MKRNLLNDLKKLIFELVEIESDVAKLDVSDRMTSIKRVKRALVLHIRTTTLFKKNVDNIRKSIITTKEKDLKKSKELEDS